jgi:hypothetical protein
MTRVEVLAEEEGGGGGRASLEQERMSERCCVLFIEGRDYVCVCV